MVHAAKVILEHWNVPIESGVLKTLEGTYRDLSQAAHGGRKALEALERMRPDLIPSVASLARITLEWVQEADLRLNGHRP